MSDGPTVAAHQLLEAVELLLQIGERIVLLGYGLLRCVLGDSLGFGQRAALLDVRVVGALLVRSRHVRSPRFPPKLLGWLAGAHAAGVVVRYPVHRRGD